MSINYIEVTWYFDKYCNNDIIVVILKQSTVYGMNGYLGFAQIPAELEPERIHGRSRWLKLTVELALDQTLRLKNVTRTHARVRHYNIVNSYHYHSLKHVY